MLQSLTIENYALIAHSHIEFEKGFVVITGETGAGKSILLGALGLLLGQRADCQSLRDKTKKCVVEAVFDISCLDLQPFFALHELDYDPNLILRREILPSAKSRAFVNDTPVALPLLHELGLKIVDIHAQHQTLRLGDALFQTSLLDALSPQPDLLARYRDAYQDYVEVKKRLEQLMAEEQQNKKDLDYHQFLFDELFAAHLVADEQQELEQESTLLANAETIKESLSQALRVCDGDEDSALSRLLMAKNQLSHSADFLPALKELQERFDSSLIELRDILSELDSLNDQVQYNPERQQEVDQRLDVIYRLQKKHNVSMVAELLAIQDDLDRKLQSVSTLDEQIQKAMEEVDKAFATIQGLAEQITAARQKAALLMEQDILPILADLGMKEARLQVCVSPTANYGPQGCDEVRFLFNANKGGELRDIAKVASGGELSRLMLALKSIVARASLLPTIIFDEIDSGISGDISMRVSHILERMSLSMQVIAISHMPQIAARANQHLKVAKAVEDESTVSRIRQLSTDERIEEIAMMLSSDNPTDSALQTARELMQR